MANPIETVTTALYWVTITCWLAASAIAYLTDQSDTRDIWLSLLLFGVAIGLAFSPLL